MNFMRLKFFGLDRHIGENDKLIWTRKAGYLNTKLGNEEDDKIIDFLFRVEMSDKDISRLGEEIRVWKVHKT